MMNFIENILVSLRGNVCTPDFIKKILVALQGNVCMVYFIMKILSSIRGNVCMMDFVTKMLVAPMRQNLRNFMADILASLLGKYK